MLSHLRIENFAIIQNLELDFEKGFTVFTGETGAGKSIIIDAISLLLGKPSQESFIGPYAPYAVVEGTFILSEESFSAIPALKEWIEPGEALLVSRKISKKKETTCRINGQSIPLKTCRALMQPLAQIVGQHDFMQLMDPPTQLAILDQSGGQKLAEKKAAYLTTFQQFKTIENTLHSLQMDDAHKVQELEFIRFQVQELEAAGLKRGEEEDLLKQKQLLKESEKMSQFVQTCQTELDALEATFPRLQKPLSHLTEHLKEVSEFETTIEKAQALLPDMQQALEHLSHTMAQAASSTLDDLESRLDTLYKLKTKYRCPNEDALIDLLYHLKEKSDLLTQNSRSYQDLEAECHQLKVLTLELGVSVSALRRQLADTLSKAVTQRLQALHFTHAVFEVRLTDLPHPQESGLDQVAFYIQTNPGHPLQPLAKVASGGELSRIMLAIRSLAFEPNPFSTLIFDEVDVGIGGLTATTVGDYLKKIAQAGNPVCCITHLPQLAAKADRHFHVKKEVKKGQTQIQVHALSGQERQAELARMVGGKEVLDILENVIY